MYIHLITSITSRYQLTFLNRFSIFPTTATKVDIFEMITVDDVLEQFVTASRVVGISTPPCVAVANRVATTREVRVNSVDIEI
ncbi:hypothetical protein AB4278_17405 [Vibrio splendidus]